MAEAGIDEYESWRCCKNINVYCPIEGCPSSYGCARDKGWLPGMESPRECRGLPPISLQERAHD